MERDLVRTCIFRPYRKGMGPVFILRMFDPVYRNGRDYLSYTLSANGKIIFQGNDFGCSPIDAIDSDNAVNALMGFLTLRPGDTDADYFRNYSAEQLQFCAEHAEALSCEVYNRFGE